MKECIVCGKQFVPVIERQQTCCGKCTLSCKAFPKKSETLDMEVDGFDCPERICVVCGDTFSAKNRSHAICSDTCRDTVKNQNRKTYNHVCDVCGKSFVHNQPNTKRCSPECLKIFNRSRHVPVHKSYDNNKTQEIKCQIPLVFNDISLRNKGILSRPANMWHRKGFTNGLKEEIKKRDGWQCYVCGKTTNLHVHHIIPRVEGGEHTPDNLVTLCGGCHRSIESGNTENAIEKCVARAMNNI